MQNPVSAPTVSNAQAGPVAPATAAARRAGGGWPWLAVAELPLMMRTTAGVASDGTTTTAALMSADSSTVAFANNGKNLSGSNRNGELRVYAKTVATASTVVNR